MFVTSTFSESRLIISRKALAPLLCVFLLFYLGFHAVSGERGLFALFKETRRLEALQAELIKVKANRVQLEGKVKRLSNDSLDLDMLDEQARRQVGLAGKDELVIFHSAPSGSE